MIDHLKRVLVKSYIGVVGLGYLLAVVTQYFVSMFTVPLAEWAGRNAYRGSVTASAANLSQPLRAAVSQGTSFVLLLVVWYVLLRWLYFSPIKEKAL